MRSLYHILKPMVDSTKKHGYVTNEACVAAALKATDARWELPTDESRRTYIMVSMIVAVVGCLQTLILGTLIFQECMTQMTKMLLTVICQCFHNYPSSHPLILGAILQMGLLPLLGRFITTTVTTPGIPAELNARFQDHCMVLFTALVSYPALLHEINKLKLLDLCASSLLTASPSCVVAAMVCWLNQISSKPEHMAGLLKALHHNSLFTTLVFASVCQIISEVVPEVPNCPMISLQSPQTATASNEEYRTAIKNFARILLHMCPGSKEVKGFAGTGITLNMVTQLVGRLDEYWYKQYHAPGCGSEWEDDNELLNFIQSCYTAMNKEKEKETV